MNSDVPVEPIRADWFAIEANSLAAEIGSAEGEGRGSELTQQVMS